MVSRGTWAKIRQSNRFYVDTYRRAVAVLIFSVALSIALCVAIYYVYFGQSGHDFYATNGETPPIPLTAMDERNYTSNPLLANDVEQDINTKAMPY